MKPEILQRQVRILADRLAFALALLENNELNDWADVGTEEAEAWQAMQDAITSTTETYDHTRKNLMDQGLHKAALDRIRTMLRVVAKAERRNDRDQA